MEVIVENGRSSKAGAAGRRSKGTTRERAKGRQFEEGGLPHSVSDGGIWCLKRKALMSKEDRMCRGEG